ncbi:hypothetical protein QZH41_008766 [Actinostola sp. cb2023]|nr:hypothetical protein QZH41_008766 [Actinostola sp. cb2023]
MFWQELSVRLTDDSDPFFLYSLVLNEEDFQSLKSQQGLLVDFGSFPQKFVDLLEMCLTEEHKDMPKFLLQFVSTSGSYERGVGNLNIIETNPFKHLTHLSLRFLPGNDTEVKKYLADCLKKFKEEKTSLEYRLSSTEQDLQQRLENCQEMKSKTLQEFEKERKEQEQSHRNTVKNLEYRNAEADAQIKKLTDKKYQNENTIRELRTKLSGLEGEYTHMKDELSSLRRGNSVLNSEQHERDKTLAHLRTRVAVLEQELRDKEQIISRTNDLLEAASEHKIKQERMLEGQQQEIKKLEKGIQSVSSDVVKGNEIIQRLQSERQAMKAKLQVVISLLLLQIKLKEILTNKQEKIITEKDSELQDYKKGNETQSETLKRQEEEVRKISETLQATTEKLEESKQLLKTNENVINYLNRQMNDQMIVTQRHGTFELHSSKDPVPNRGSTTGIVKNITPPQAFVPRYGSNTQLDTCGYWDTCGGDRGRQVTYRPATQRKPTFPRPLTHSTPTIPEEDELRSPVTTTTSSVLTPNIRINNENQPLLDPKYLQRKDQIIEGSDQYKENVPREKRVLQPTQRFGPNVRTVPCHPPLMSAYFPKDS